MKTDVNYWNVSRTFSEITVSENLGRIKKLFWTSLV